MRIDAGLLGVDGRIVIPVVVGSSPIGHPKSLRKINHLSPVDKSRLSHFPTVFRIFQRGRVCFVLHGKYFPALAWQKIPSIRRGN